MCKGDETASAGRYKEMLKSHPDATSAAFKDEVLSMSNGIGSVAAALFAGKNKLLKQ